MSRIVHLYLPLERLLIGVPPSPTSGHSLSLQKVQATPLPPHSRAADQQQDARQSIPPGKPNLMLHTCDHIRIPCRCVLVSFIFCAKDVFKFVISDYQLITYLVYFHHHLKLAPLVLLRRPTRYPTK